MRGPEDRRRGLFLAITTYCLTGGSARKTDRVTDRVPRAVSERRSPLETRRSRIRRSKKRGVRWPRLPSADDNEKVSDRAWRPLGSVANCLAERRNGAFRSHRHVRVPNSAAKKASADAGGKRISRSGEDAARFSKGLPRCAFLALVPAASMTALSRGKPVRRAFGVGKNVLQRHGQGEIGPWLSCFPETTCWRWRSGTAACGSKGQCRDAVPIYGTSAMGAQTEPPRCLVYRRKRTVSDRPPVGRSRWSRADPFSLMSDSGRTSPSLKSPKSMSRALTRMKDGTQRRR